MRHRKIVLMLLGFVALFGQDSGIELVIDPQPGDSGSTTIHSVSFLDDSTLRVVFTNGRSTQIAQIGGQENSLAFNASMLGHHAASVVGNTLIALAPLQAELYDIRRQRQINTLKVDGIDAWPLACGERGLCAWQSGSQLHVEPVSGAGQRSDWPVGQSAVLSLDFSPNERILAAGINEARVRLWNLAEGRELPPLEMEATADGSTLGAPASLNEVLPRSFVFPRPGMATAVRFSPDGSLLAAANETGVHIWRVATRERVSLLRGYKGRLAAMSFGSDSRTLVIASEDKVIRLLRLGQQQRTTEICKLLRMPHFVALRGDAAFVALGFSDGSIELWNTNKKTLAAVIRVLPDGWIATTPAGFFDTSEQAWHRASWQFRGAGTRIPLEAFYKDFYRPGLIADALTGNLPQAGPRIETMRPELPSVRLTALETKRAQITLVPGQGIQNQAERVRFRVEARPASANGAVFDMEVALNGIVVKKWLGSQPIVSGAAVHEVELEMPPGDVRVTASAFSESDLRSPEGVWERPMQGFGYAVPQRTLYFLGIGIRTYKNPAFNLNFADSDVMSLAKALRADDEDLQKISRRVMDWSNRRTLDTLQSGRLYEVPAHVQVRTLLNQQATRGAILNALREIAKDAQPKDAMIIYYAGHGLTDDEQYYMLPWDMALQGAPESLDGRMLKSARGSLITDDDIADALSDLNVKFGALILDSCFSAQALKESGLVGPIHPQGLTGWAYEKGISLLAASEASNPSFEIKKLGASVLATALVREGLVEKRADSRPLDGSVELEEWLRYGASRVSSLARETSGLKGSSSPQNARLAPSRLSRKEALILTAADKEP